MKKFWGLITTICCLVGVVMCLAQSKNVLATETTDESAYVIVEVSADDIASDGAYKAVQTALNQAKSDATETAPYKVVVPEGSYELTRSLHIYGNTWLYAEGVTFTRASDAASNVIRVGESDDTNSGYYYENIIIEGATLDQNEGGYTTVKIAHASNVTLKNCVVKNSVDAHLMEVAGVQGLTIEGCTFQDQIVEDTDNIRYEAIQIDILEEYHFSGYLYEDLANKNIVIDNCTFKNVPRGVGSHTAVLNNPVDGVQITNCTFTDCETVAIQGMNWINVTISNNTITGSPRGIAIYSIRENGVYLASTLASEGETSYSTSCIYQELVLDQNILISDNSITTSGTDPYKDYEESAITVGGISLSKATTGNSLSDGTGDSVPAGDYSVSGVTISGNTISTMGHGIRLEWTKNAAIDNNTITSTGAANSSTTYYGIQLRETSTDNTITNNVIKNTKSHGIFINSSSGASSVKSNTITSAGGEGIRVEGSSIVTTISNNTISKATLNGIYVYNSAKVTTISSNKITSVSKNGVDVQGATATTIKSNTITSPTSNGIYIYKSGKASTISSNTITSAGKYGIDVENSTATTISSNTISKAKSNGIFIYSSGKSTTISSNTISSAGNYGIAVNGSTVSTIKSNTISSSSSNGIFISNSGKVTTVSSNTIKSAGKYGIGVDGGTATTIKNNTITSPTNHGIYVQSSGKIATISGNTIKSGKKRGISINSIKCAMTISGNTISACKGEALIYLNPNSTSYKITVKSNKLTASSSVNGIYGTKCKVSISSNTIKSANKAIVLTTTVKGTVNKNTYSGNKSNKLTYGSVAYANLSTPSSVKATKKSSTSIKISWNKVSNASGYYIYRSTSKSGTYSKVATVSKGSTVSYTNKSLTKGKTYYYKVVAYRKTSNGNVIICSSYSSVVSKSL